MSNQKNVVSSLSALFLTNSSSAGSTTPRNEYDHACDTKTVAFPTRCPERSCSAYEVCDACVSGLTTQAQTWAVVLTGCWSAARYSLRWPSSSVLSASASSSGVTKSSAAIAARVLSGSALTSSSSGRRALHRESLNRPSSRMRRKKANETPRVGTSPAISPSGFGGLVDRKILLDR